MGGARRRRAHALRRGVELQGLQPDAPHGQRRRRIREHDGRGDADDGVFGRRLRRPRALYPTRKLGIDLERSVERVDLERCRDDDFHDERDEHHRHDDDGGDHPHDRHLFHDHRDDHHGSDDDRRDHDGSYDRCDDDLREHDGREHLVDGRLSLAVRLPGRRQLVSQTRTCTTGMCGFSYQPFGTLLSDTMPGDCESPACDGVGGTTTVATNDPPVSTNQCQMGVCSGTMGSFQPVADHTACSQSGGNVCSGGNCIGCITTPDCPSGACIMGTCVPDILISEVRTRGAGGASDEFIELYNPLSTPVVLSSSIAIMARSNTGSTYTMRWQGAGQTLPGHKHFLIGGTAYAGSPAADATLTTGITDEVSLVLVTQSTILDNVCIYCGTNPFDATYQCAGTPINKPNCATNTTGAVERKPGGTLGNGTNTGDNASDFVITDPSNQRDLASPQYP